MINKKALACVFMATSFSLTSSFSSFAMMGAGQVPEKKVALSDRVDCDDYYEFNLRSVFAWPKLIGKGSAVRDLNEFTEKIVAKLVKRAQKEADKAIAVDKSILHGFTITTNDLSTHIGVEVVAKIRVPKPSKGANLPGLILSCDAKIV